MSLQRVLDLARRQGLPVVVTDVAGREPLVVLPLEVYEGLLEDRDKKRIGNRESGIENGNQVYPIPDAPKHPPADTLRVRQRDEDRVSTLHRSLDSVSESAPTSLPAYQPTPSSDLSLEERFVFQT